MKGARRRREAHIPGGEPLSVLLALSVGSGRLPGMTQDKVLPIASVRYGIITGPIELRRVETFTGAACLPRRLSVAPKR